MVSIMSCISKLIEQIQRLGNWREISVLPRFISQRATFLFFTTDTDVLLLDSYLVTNCRESPGPLEIWVVFVTPVAVRERPGDKCGFSFYRFHF